MGVLEKYAPVEGGSVLGKYKAEEFRPGEDWTVPIQDEHPDMGMFSRIGLKTFADAGPETMIANLENMGFEARHRGNMRFSLRKPGEKDWYVLDPEQFELLDDLTDFIPGALLPVAGTIYGGAKGAATGTAIGGPVGGVVGGITGAGLGSGSGEAVKQGLGSLFGYETDLGEVGRKVALEGAAGALGQAAAPVLGSALSRSGQALGKLGSKYTKARDVRTILEGPARKTRTEFTGAAPTMLEKAFTEVQEVPLPELTKKAKSLTSKLETAMKNGEPTELLEKKLKVVNDARDVQKALNKAKRSGEGVATEKLSKDSFVRQIAEDMGIPTFGRTYEGVVSKLDDVLTDKRFSEYLATGQDPAVKEAIERQMGTLVEDLMPKEWAQQAFSEMGPISRMLVSPPDIARRAGQGFQRLRSGAASGLEKAAGVVGLPGKGFDVATTKLRETLTPGEGITHIGAVGSGLGVAYGLGVGPAAAKLAATGIGSKLAAGALRKTASVIMGDPRVLLAHANKAKGILATKLRKPLEILQKRGREAYIAAVYTMLHDPVVRQYFKEKSK